MFTVNGNTRHPPLQRHNGIALAQFLQRKDNNDAQMRQSGLQLKRNINVPCIICDTVMIHSTKYSTMGCCNAKYENTKSNNRLITYGDDIFDVVCNM